MDNVTTPMAPPSTVAIKDTKEVLCECGSNVFQQFINLREVSAIITGTGRNEFIPVAMVCCAKCHKRFEPPTLITPA